MKKEYCPPHCRTVNFHTVNFIATSQDATPRTFNVTTTTTDNWGSSNARIYDIWDED